MTQLNINIKITWFFTALLIAFFGLWVQTTIASDKFGGGSSGAGSGSGSGCSNCVTRDVIGSARINGVNYTVSQYSNRIGPSLDRVVRDESDSDNFNPRGSNQPSCQQTPDISAVDILFVRAGTYSGTARPGNNIIVNRANLEVGVSYQPVVELRNLNCNSTAAFNNTGTQHKRVAFWSVAVQNLLGAIKPTEVHAGGMIGATPSRPLPPTPSALGSTLSGNNVNQLPFGSNGGFPVRLQIDYGQNGTFEYTEFLNNRGPIRGSSISSPNSQISVTNSTIYVPFPAVTLTEMGNHSVTVSADVTNTQAVGRGCTSLVAAPRSFIDNLLNRPLAAPLVSPIDWGCINELTPAGARSEGNNVLTQTFGVGPAINNGGLRVNVADVRVRLGESLTRVPFTVQNISTSTLPGYTYTIRIGGTQVGAGNRTITLNATQTDAFSGSVTYTVPSSPITVPLEVCATSALLGVTNCANAQVIVFGTQCSDRSDNDSDGTTDTTDPGCFTDPLDPDTYDPDDNNEGDISTTSPSVTIEFKPVVSPVRYDSTAVLTYTIQGPAPMSCQVTGGGTNTNVTHSPSTTSGQVTTTPVRNTQQFTMRCTATVGGTTLEFVRTTIVDVLPLAQET
jgi:hypothetical protein